MLYSPSQIYMEPCFEWWRYIGPEKPRQPRLHTQQPEGACLSEALALNNKAV